MAGFEIDQFIADCRSALSETKPQLAVRDVVERAVSDPSSIENSLGPARGWKLEPLFHDADLTILHIVWPPTVDLFPHEHRMWSTVGVYGGTEDNTMFRRSGDNIERVGQKQGRTGDVLLMGVDGIHSVQNTTREWTGTIHVYGGDFFATSRLQWDTSTGDSAPFDVRNARANLAAAEDHARSTGVV